MVARWVSIAEGFALYFCTITSTITLQWAGVYDVVLDRDISSYILYSTALLEVSVVLYNTSPVKIAGKQQQAPCRAHGVACAAVCRQDKND